MLNDWDVIVVPPVTGNTEASAPSLTIFATKSYGAPSRMCNCFIVASIGSSTTETPIWKGVPGFDSKPIVLRSEAPENIPLGRPNSSLLLRCRSRNALEPENRPPGSVAISLSSISSVRKELKPLKASSCTLSISLSSTDRKSKSDKPCKPLASSEVIPLDLRSKPTKLVKLLTPAGISLNSGLFVTPNRRIVPAGSPVRIREPSPVKPTLSSVRTCSPGKPALSRWSMFSTRSFGRRK